MTDSAGLAGNAAACDGDNNVNLAQQIGGDQGLTNDQLQGLQTEVIVDITAVDDNGAGAVLVNAFPLSPHPARAVWAPMETFWAGFRCRI